MKKIHSFAVVLSVVASLAAQSTVFAQGTQASLPSAGLTPESSFYFLDRLVENLQEFFTFNPEARAKLQVEFAGERISEIKVMIDKKGSNAKGLEKAESLLQAHVAEVGDILNEEKTSGKDVAELAKTLNDEFDTKDQLLKQTFKDAIAQLKAERKVVKTNLQEARRIGDVAQAAVLEAQVKDIETQIDALEQKKETLKDTLQAEQDDIEDEMNEADQKQEDLEQKEEDEAVEAEEEAETDESEEADEQEESDKGQEVSGNDRE